MIYYVIILQDVMLLSSIGEYSNVSTGLCSSVLLLAEFLLNNVWLCGLNYFSLVVITSFIQSHSRYLVSQNCSRAANSEEDD